MTSKHKPSDRNADLKNAPAPKPKRGRLEKLVKLDDTPLNVARSFFGIPSDKFNRLKS